MCSSSTASLSEFIQRDQEEDAFDTSAVPGGCSRSLAESYERGYFRSDMDLYVSLWHGLQSPSLRRVWISAIDAWIILLFITCFQARELATATRRLTLPTCMEIGLISVPYEARTSLKQHKSNPNSATFSRLGGVFELCCSVRQSLCQKSLHQLTCPSELQPGSWGSSRLSLCWVLTEEQWNCATWWEWMCCPTCGILISAACLKTCLLPYGLLMSHLWDTGECWGSRASSLVPEWCYILSVLARQNGLRIISSLSCAVG